MLARMRGKRITQTWLVGMQNGTGSLKTVMTLTTQLPYNRATALLGAYRRCVKMCVHANTRT